MMTCGRHGYGTDTVCRAHPTARHPHDAEGIKCRESLIKKVSGEALSLLDECGLIVVTDCPTRWSSSFNMISRLLKVKDSVCQIANMGWDSLLSSEWQKLKSLHELLLPFAEHTQALQSDTMSLVVPALFDLLNRLSDFEESASHRDLATLARKMKGSVSQRFAWILDPADETFSPLVAAACFVNPTVCETLVDVADENIQELLKQAEENVIQFTQSHSQHEDQSRDDGEENRRLPEEAEAAPSTSKQPVFRFLSKCFCREAIQCFGDLTRGRRNRARVTLAQSAFLKITRTK
ncbi:uncharacterized protein LOC119264046 [Pygocentrus nattereri]|uniref:uncharacterized protein LOC119264046 n=1 Tax=Pygocentrus nattereri TaxID=42514 RepID=UPI00189169B9|nr:uncharacterized protein LOC119264046 [Pygocentrus nattereri]